MLNLILSHEVSDLHLCLQTIAKTRTIASGVRRAAAPEQGAKDVSERVPAGAEPLAGALRPTQREAPGPGHLHDQTGQPL